METTKDSCGCPSHHEHGPNGPIECDICRQMSGEAVSSDIAVTNLTRKHKSGRGSPEARKRANRNYYQRHRAALCEKERKRYWVRKLAGASDV